MEKVMICGVDCHPDDENCNGYCVGKEPMARTYIADNSKDLWVVIDDDGEPVFCAGSKQRCNEHINNAINDFDIEFAALWKVRQAKIV